MRILTHIIKSIIWLSCFATVSSTVPSCKKYMYKNKELSAELIPINERDLRRTMSGLNECTQSITWEYDNACMNMKIASIMNAELSVKFLSSPRRSDIEKMAYISTHCRDTITRTDITSGGLMNDWNSDAFDTI